MGRRSSRELVKRIASTLSRRPQSVQDIATAIDADHTSVRNYLESLAEAGIIKVEEEDGSSTFYLSDRSTDNADTYFGLPLSEEQETRLHSLFALIKELWEEQTGNVPGPTQAQKVAVHVLEEHDLNIPHGWYLYGSITAGVFDPDRPYEYTGLPQEGEVKESTEEAVKNVSEPDTWNEVRLQQYREKEKELYLTKERIVALFTDYEELWRNPDNLEDEFDTFLQHLPPMSDPEAEEVITELVVIAPRLLRDADTRATVQLRCAMISDAFNKVWDLVALYEFYEDMQEYYKEDVLHTHLMREQQDRKEDAIKALSNLANVLPEQEGPDNPYYQQLKDLESDGGQGAEQSGSNVFGKFGVE